MIVFQDCHFLGLSGLARNLFFRIVSFYQIQRPRLVLDHHWSTFPKVYVVLGSDGDVKSASRKIKIDQIVGRMRCLTSMIG